MALAENMIVSYDDFLRQRDISDDRLEYIDRIVYMTPAPSPLHQKICFKVAKILDGHVTGLGCQMLQGVNVRFLDEKGNKIGDVIPDVTVFCNYRNINATFIDEIPSLIVEIVSPSTVFTDNIEKAGLYRRAGVKEYWIVDSKSQCITVWNFSLGEQMIYHDAVKSYLFKDLSIEVPELFKS